MVKKRINGFTLIEIVVVMAIIAALGTLMIGTIRVVRATSRNTKRKSDLRTIQMGLINYHSKNKNFIGAGSGCGYGGNGSGWYNFSDGGQYPKSISQCLIDDGSLSSEVVDPSGQVSFSQSVGGYAYMKYACGTNKTFLFARLEGEPWKADVWGPEICPSSTSVQNADTGWGMNYYVIVE